MPRGGKKTAEEIVYWTPEIKPESSNTIPAPVDAVYYTPPQTPQEAIDAGLIRTTAEKPKNYVPHNKRLAYGSPALPGWHCMWGCCGSTLAPFDKNWPGVTHDYYCPFWELLALFPEWEEDFQLKPWHRPPQPKNGEVYPPLNEWNTADENANYARRSREVAPVIIKSGVTRNTGRKRIKNSPSKSDGKGTRNSSSGFTISDVKQKRSSGNRDQT